MPKVTSGIRKSPSELKSERNKRYRAKQKLSPQVERLEKVVSSPKQSRKEQASKIISEQKKPKPLARFVSLDGEGNNWSDHIDKQGKRHKSEHQDYVLLRSSSEQLDPLYNPKGLSTVSCFSWLCNLALKEHGATFVGFGLSYDITMWMRDIPYKDQVYLRTYMQAGDIDKYDFVEEKGEKKKKRKLFPPTYEAIVDDVPNT